MLVLSRKTEEAIRISDDIRIVIVKSGANRVRIAIEAPQSVHIEREELWLRRQEFANEAKNAAPEGDGAAQPEATDAERGPNPAR